MKKRFFALLFVLILTVPSFAALPGNTDSHNRITASIHNKKMMEDADSLNLPFIKNETQLDSRVKYYAGTFAGTVFITDDAITYGLTGGSLSGGCGWAIKEKLLKGTSFSPTGKNQTTARVNYIHDRNQKGRHCDFSTFRSVDLGEIYKKIRLELKAYGRNVEKLFIIEQGGNPGDIVVGVEGAAGINTSPTGELEIHTGAGTVKMSAPVAYQEIAGKRTEVPVRYALHDNLTYGFKTGSYNRNYPLVIDPLLASTFIGAYGEDVAYAIDVDSGGYVFIAGASSSSGYPTTSGAYDNSTGMGAEIIVSKFTSDLTTLVASTYLEGGGYAFDLAIDAYDDVYIVGKASTDFPATAGAYDETHNGGLDAFVAKLSNDLSTLSAATFLGGYNPEVSFVDDVAYAVAIDNGSIFVAGRTDSPDFPTTPGAYDETFNDFTNADTFVAKLTADLSTLLASTYIGHNNNDEFERLALDSSGHVFITGSTSSWEYPTTAGAYDETHSGGFDAFVSKFSNDLSTLMASTLIGGTKTDIARKIAVDAEENIIITGGTSSSNYPTTPGVYDETHNDVYDAFVSKFSNDLSTLVASTVVGGRYSDMASALTIDSAGNIFVAGDTYSFDDFPITAGALDESFNGQSDVFVAKLNSSLTKLSASTYIGGVSNDRCLDIILDGTGNLLMTGKTYAVDYPTTTGAYDATHNDNESIYYFDVFVSKLTPNLDGPTLVTLESLTAVPSNKKVTISWVTASEIDNVGFNLYRAKNGGDYVKINPNLIPAAGSATEGAVYEFVDEDVQNRKTYQYKLEDVERSGTTSMHGPVAATPRLIYAVGW